MLVHLVYLLFVNHWILVPVVCYQWYLVCFYEQILVCAFQRDLVLAYSR